MVASQFKLAWGDFKLENLNLKLFEVQNSRVK